MILAKLTDGALSRKEPGTRRVRETSDLKRRYRKLGLVRVDIPGTCIVK